MKHPQMDEALLRQRRNLMIVSCTLVVASLAGAEFSKLAVLGTELTFERRWILRLGAWLLWLYFLLRYLQYFLEVPELGIRSDIEARLISYVVSVEEGARMRCSFMRTWPLRVNVAGGGYDPGQGGYSMRAAQLSKWQRLWWPAKALVAVSIKTPRVTDYVLPFVVAAAAPAVALLAWVLDSGVTVWA